MPKKKAAKRKPRTRFKPRKITIRTYKKADNDRIDELMVLLGKGHASVALMEAANKLPEMVREISTLKHELGRAQRRIEDLETGISSYFESKENIKKLIDC